MAKNIVYLLAVVTALCLVNFAAGNIHRAIPGRGKGIKSEEDDLELTFFDRVYSRTKEAWVYSLLASLLVGSTGIFPLLIFPSEAGKSMKEGVSPAHLKILLSFAVGGLLGDVFLHLLPEAWMYVNTGPNMDHFGHVYIGLWVIGGFLSFLIFEKVFGDEDERGEATGGVESATNLDGNKAVINGSCKISENNYKQMNGHPRHTQNGIKETKTDISNGISNGVNGITKGVASMNGHCKSNGHSVTDVVKRRNGDVHCNGLSNNNGHVAKDYSSQKTDTLSDSKKKEHIQAIGYLNLLANCIDNFTHGLAVAGSFVVGTKVGMCTTFAILLHEVPHEVGDFAILLKSGFRRKDAAIGQIVTASGALFGAVFGLMAEGAGDSSAWILPFTSGGFIYIAMVTVVPDLIKETSLRETFKQLTALLLGVAAMGIVSSIHH